MRRALAWLAAATLTAGLLAAPPAPASPPTVEGRSTWFVRAGSGATQGTQARPFGSLAMAERRSRPGDTIVILPSAKPLDGGIRLKPGQTLRGAGPDVRRAGRRAAWLTNTTRRLRGDAVRLADRATVRNLRITGTRRGAVYGRDVTGVRVTGNDIAGHNTSCARGFLIPEFMAPTTVPGVGIPISGGLQNGWAGIMIDAPKRRGFRVRIDHNLVRDATCGDGIDVRAWGRARGRALITDNAIRSLRQGPGFKSILAIGLQARNRARLVGAIHRNTQALLGEPTDIDLAVHGADSEGVFLNAVGPATLRALVTRNRYTNKHGWGGFSANGLEMVSMGKGARMHAVVKDSHFSGAPGDLIEHGGLGTDAVMTMILKRVTAERSTGIGNTYLLPFNNGDCVLAGSLGARNTMRLTIRRSIMRKCANNGVALGSNVVNGSGPTSEISATITGSTITGNRGANVGIRNYTALRRLLVRLERNDLRRSALLNSAAADLAVDEYATTVRAVIDAGGGALGSRGGNCLVGGLFAARVSGYDVAARRNWWGRPGGPAPLRTLATGGALDTGRPLAARPRHC